MQRHCFVKGTEMVSPSGGEGGSNLAVTFFPSREERSVDVVGTLDLKAEIELAQQVMRTEGLKSIEVKINGIKFRVGSQDSYPAAEQKYLGSCGNFAASGAFEIDSKGIGFLDNAVYTACLVSRLTDKAVQFTFNEPGMQRYQTATVFKQDSPEEVFGALKRFAESDA